MLFQIPLINFHFIWIFLIDFILNTIYKLAIASYNFRISGYKRPIVINKLRIAIYKLAMASYNFRISGYKRPIMINKLRIVRYKVAFAFFTFYLAAEMGFHTNQCCYCELIPKLVFVNWNKILDENFNLKLKMLSWQLTKINKLKY